MMNRLSCIECKQCNRKGKPSVSRYSKYCDTHYIHRVKTKKSIFGFLSNIRDKITDKRLDEQGQLKTTKGFRRSWFWR